MKKKQIYVYVRCETKHCDNNFKLLKIPKILAGKQKCQICKYVMKTVKVNKDIEVVENKKTKNKRKITHFFPKDPVPPVIKTVLLFNIISSILKLFLLSYVKIISRLLH